MLCSFCEVCASDHGWATSASPLWCCVHFVGYVPMTMDGPYLLAPCDVVFILRYVTMDGPDLLAPCEVVFIL